MSNRIIIDQKLERVIIKYSVLVTLFTFILSRMISKSVADIIDVFLGFLFQFDFDKNGVADITQLKKIDLNFGKYTFSLGKLVFAILKLILQILVIILIIKFIISYTHLIKT